MIKRRLTFKKMFDHYNRNDFTIAAKFSGEDSQHICITEPIETIYGGITCRQEHYLVGPIVDRLYAYEQLGFTPEELKDIIQEHKTIENMQKAVDDARRYVFVTTGGRGNGKTELQRQLYDYIVNDIKTTRFHADMWDKENMCLDKKPVRSGRYPWGTSVPEIKNVIFNDPATIVFWLDGTKTVVKATNEDFDPEKGLAMAISKKVLGNKGNYFDKIKKWTKEAVK